MGRCEKHCPEEVPRCATWAFSGCRIRQKHDFWHILGCWRYGEVWFEGPTGSNYRGHWNWYMISRSGHSPNRFWDCFDTLKSKKKHQDATRCNKKTCFFPFFCSIYKVQLLGMSSFFQPAVFFFRNAASQVPLWEMPELMCLRLLLGTIPLAPQEVEMPMERRAVVAPPFFLWIPRGYQFFTMSFGGFFFLGKVILHVIAKRFIGAHVLWMVAARWHFLASWWTCLGPKSMYRICIYGTPNNVSSTPSILKLYA